jgi:quaternary ammonium compound-resistance protein SugE
LKYPPVYQCFNRWASGNFSHFCGSQNDDAMAWFYLLIAGILEVVWAVGMKYSEGWTKLYPSIFTIVSMIIGFYFLSLAVKTLPLGTAYAVWTGIGTIGTVIFGIIFFKEPFDVIKAVCILLIVIGIVGLKLFHKA